MLQVIQIQRKVCTVNVALSPNYSPKVLVEHTERTDTEVRIMATG